MQQLVILLVISSSETCWGTIDYFKYSLMNRMSDVSGISP